MDPSLYANQIAIFSDLHCGLRQNSAKWHQITVEWAQWFAAELKKRNIKDVIFLGDFFDNRSEISVSTLAAGARVLDVLRDFNIIMVVGNHDSWYRDRAEVNSLSILKHANIQVIEIPTTLQVGSRKCLFLPWGYKETDLQPVDIIFGHLEIESFRMNSYKFCEKGLKVKSLRNNAPLTFTGHFHLKEERAYESSKIIYTGNTFQMDFGDIDSVKGFYLLKLDSLDYEFIENTISPVHRKITLTELQKFGNFDTPAVHQFFTNNIVKLIIDKRLSADNIDILQKKISILNPLHLSIDYSINFNSDVTLSEGDLQGIDIAKTIEEFIGYLDGPQAEVNAYCQELYKRCK